MISIDFIYEFRSIRRCANQWGLKDTSEHSARLNERKPPYFVAASVTVANRPSIRFVSSSSIGAPCRA